MGVGGYIKPLENDFIESLHSKVSIRLFNLKKFHVVLHGSRRLDAQQITQWHQIYFIWIFIHELYD